MRWLQLIALPIALASFNTCASADNDCVDFFSNSQRDIRTVDSRRAAMIYLYDNFCKRSKDTNKIGAAVSLFSGLFGASGSSDSEKVESFCKNAEHLGIENDSLATRDERIVRESFSSFNTCEAITRNKINITQTYSAPSSLVVHFDNPNNNLAVNVLRVQANKTNMSCDLVEPRGTTSLSQRFKPTKIAGVSFDITCTRKPTLSPRSARGQTVFGRENFIVSTDISGAAPLLLVMPSEVIDPPILASEKDKQIHDLTSQLHEEKRIHAADVKRLETVNVKSYIITSMYSALTPPEESVSRVRDLRSRDLEPTAKCGDGYNWGNHIPMAAKTLCQRDNMVVKEIILIDRKFGGPCGLNAFMLTCANR